MPQMAPINWSILFMIFIILFLLSMTLVYFLQLPTSYNNQKNNLYNATPINLNWKW